QSYRQAESIRRAAEAHAIQDFFLDPEREQFIKTEMHTTVLQGLDFGATQRAYDELEDKFRRLTAAQAASEAAYVRLSATHASNFKVAGEKVAGDNFASTGPIPSKSSAKASDTKRVVIYTESAIPATPRGVLDMVRRKVQGRIADGLGKVQASPPAAIASGVGRLAALQQSVSSGPAASLPATPSVPRARLTITCLESDALRPRMAAGIGDGQLAVYYLYRAHGQRRRMLHQIQGFDASRREGDIITALFLPSKGVQAGSSPEVQDVVIAGFESGRVAVFQAFVPADWEREAEMGVEKTEKGRELAQRISLGEPILSAAEPLVLEHYHCQSPVVALFWHPIMGIFSITTFGNVVVADTTTGTLSCCIPAACGRNATVTCADLSLELEQLAVASQQGVYLWQNLSMAKVGVLSRPGRQSKPAMLVRYLSSNRFLFTVHAVDGEVAIWDARSLEQHSCLKTPNCPLASCATWDNFCRRLLIFGPQGMSEVSITEHLAQEEHEETIHRHRHKKLGAVKAFSGMLQHLLTQSPTAFDV
ncbi:unnamed protein product, partial [Polarella glacialis]